MARNFTKLGTKARKDPLGPQYFNLLRQNVLVNDDTQLKEHNADGTHNALDVARTTGRTLVGVLYDFNANVASIAHPGTGIFTLTLASGAFDADMVVQVTPRSETGLTLPVRPSVEVVSATSVKIHLHALAALAGNTWAAEDGDFDVAIWARPMAQPASVLSAMVDARSNLPLQAFSTWNPVVFNLAQTYSMQRVEHDATGAHNTRLVANDRTRVNYAGGTTYNVVNAAGLFASVSRTSAGVVVLTFTSAVANATYGVFVDPTYTDVFGISVSYQNMNVVQCPTTARTTTTVTVYLYQYNHTANTWAAADFDFFISIHLDAV
jgi:hypothetical protein